MWLPGVRAHHVLRETQYTTVTRVNRNMEYSSVVALQDLHAKLEIMSSLHHNTTLKLIIINSQQWVCLARMDSSIVVLYRDLQWLKR